MIVLYEGHSFFHGKRVDTGNGIVIKRELSPGAWAPTWNKLAGGKGHEIVAAVACVGRGTKSDGAISAAAHGVVSPAFGKLDVGTEFKTEVGETDAGGAIDNGGGADKFGHAFRVREHVEGSVGDLNQASDHEAWPPFKRKPMDGFAEGVLDGPKGAFDDRHMLVRRANFQVRLNILSETFKFFVGMYVRDGEAASGVKGDDFLDRGQEAGLAPIWDRKRTSVANLPGDEMEEREPLDVKEIDAESHTLVMFEDV